MQDWSVEDANSADIALGRFGREPAAAGSGSAQDADVLSAATAVQRWELDYSHERGRQAGQKEGCSRRGSWRDSSHAANPSSRWSQATTHHAVL